jgi:chemotaxis protein histidine kinase CheA
MEYSTETLQKLQQLQKKFIAELSGRISGIKTQWLNYVEIDNDEAKKDIKISLHNLAGTAGTFGYQELYKKARHLEKMLDEVADNKAKSESNAVAIMAGIDDLAHFIKEMPDPGVFSQPSKDK